MFKKVKTIATAIIVAGLFLPTQVLADQKATKESASIEKQKAGKRDGFTPVAGAALGVKDPAKKPCAASDKNCLNSKTGEKLKNTDPSANRYDF
ncbi:hypothetical protein [Ahrensia kielensis]|uniref:hypothetical protein n=1 Tax=Ahrensia kielensis TaxID=76980 RepID=UPI00037BACE3|nr:hypothetical protein [Ahrensia kielensis]